MVTQGDVASGVRREPFLVENGYCDVPRELWLRAAAVGALRQAVNDATRASDRNRGRATNRQNDVQGAFGELVAIHVFEKHLPEVSVEHCVLDLAGVVDEPDLTVDDGTRRASYEVKCHLDEPRKRMLLINDRAYRRSVRRGSSGFLPVLAVEGSTRCRLGTVIPTHAVGDWPVQTYGKHRDPARGQRLVDLNDVFGARPLPFAQEVMNPTRRGRPHLRDRRSPRARSWLWEQFGCRGGSPGTAPRGNSWRGRRSSSTSWHHHAVVPPIPLWWSATGGAGQPHLESEFSRVLPSGLADAGRRAGFERAQCCDEEHAPHSADGRCDHAVAAGR
jgi:hypothetical protein